MLKISHIAITVSDLEKSIWFYKSNFGFDCVETYDIESKGLTICLLKKEDIILELFGWQHFNPLPEYRKTLDSDLKTLGVKHFCFEVSNIKQMYESLKNAGVEIAKELNTFPNGLRYFFIKDPDGILIELFEANANTLA